MGLLDQFLAATAPKPRPPQPPTTPPGRGYIPRDTGYRPKIYYVGSQYAARNAQIAQYNAAIFQKKQQAIAANARDKIIMAYRRRVAQEQAKKGLKDRIKRLASNQFNFTKRHATDAFNATLAGTRLGHYLGTPGRYWGAMVDRRGAYQQAGRDIQTGIMDMDRQKTNYEATLDRLKGLYYGRQISYEEANKQAELAYNRMVARGQYWDKHMAELQAAVENPITGGAAKWGGRVMKVASNPVSRFAWKYTLGQGDRKVPSILTAPDRLVKYINEKTGLGSGRYYSQRVPGEVKPGTGPLVWKKGMGAWQRTYDTTYGNLRSDILEDPFSWTGAAGLGRGATARALRFAPQFSQKAAGVGRYSFNKSASLRRFTDRVPQGFKDQFEWQKGTPGDRALQWLKQQRQAPSAKLRGEAKQVVSQRRRYTESLLRELTGRRAGYYDKLTDQQLAAFKRYMDTGKLKAAKADKAVVQKFIEQNKALQSRRFELEKQSGVKFERGERQRYYATLGSGKFEKSRAWRKKFAGPDREAMEAAEAERALGHLARTDKRFGNSLTYKRFKDRREGFGAQQQALEEAAQRSYKGVRESTGRALRAPTTAAKLLWLRFNPAWYVNNALHSSAVITASGGPGALAHAAKLAVRPGNLKNLPSEVTGTQVGHELGKLSGKFAPYSENIFRGGLFKSLKAQGMSDAKAIKEVNRVMFDYSKTANWERPLLSVFPFWRWEKNINKYMATMPFKHPLFSKAYQGLQQRGIDDPYAAIQNTIADPAGGEPVTGEKPSWLKDKIRLATGVTSRWAPTGGFPLTRGSRDRLAINPLLGLATNLATGTDSFGSDMKGKTPFEALIRSFPQANLVRKGLKAANFTTYIGGKPHTIGGDREETRSWLAEETFHSKGQQGFDPSRPNYAEDLDVVKQFKDQLLSFFGVKTLDFNEDQFREDLRFQGFMRDYVKQPWDREESPGKDVYDYETKQAMRNALANKWGFDLQRDIYDGRFAQNDTPETYIRKQAQARMRRMQKALYDAYYAIPKGKSKGTGNRTEKLEEIRKLLSSDKFRKQYPGIDFWPKIDWVNKQSGFGKSGGKKGGVFKYGKWFKSNESAERYRRFIASGGKRRTSDPRRRRLAWLYQNVDPETRKEIIAREGLGRALPKRTASEWSAWRAGKTQADREKLARDESRFPQLSGLRLAAKSAAVTSAALKPPSKRGKPLTFGKQFR